MDSPEFVFSSLHAAPSNSASATPYVPRARYCIFRGFWAELPENKHNDAPMNERVYESEMPTFTTDVRMLKVPEVFASSAGKAEDVGEGSAGGPEERGQSRGSGGGGPVEAVWWVKDVGTQWRVRGEAFVVSDDIDGGSGTSGVKTVKSEVGSRMRVVKGMEGKEGEWSWSRELTGHFGNNSPGIRGMCVCCRRTSV
jgi:pyridoxamine 5'-phosphate oxidase